MRSSSAFIALLLSAAPALAQDTSASTGQAARAPDPLGATDSGQTSPVRGAAALARLRTQLAILRLSDYSTTLPTAAQFSTGNRVIPAGAVIKEAVGIVDGSLDVFGTIEGTAIVIDGNLRVHPGATISGDAITVRGRIVNQGGVVTGETRSLSTLAGDGRDRQPAPPRTTWWALKLALGWFAVLVIIGVGVMIFAESSLDGVAIALERGVGRAFLAGLFGQIAALPALLLLCVALALTLIGVLLIPFAIVAYTIAVAGLITLGFLAVARLSGLVGVRTTDLTPRGVNLRAMFIGLIGYLCLWLLAAAFTWQPVVGGVLRVIAFMITWVAATAGLGATLLSRAGTRRPGRGKPRVSGDEYAWQTPTPVSGVAASTRRK